MTSPMMESFFVSLALFFGGIRVVLVFFFVSDESFLFLANCFFFVSFSSSLSSRLMTELCWCLELRLTLIACALLLFISCPCWRIATGREECDATAPDVLVVVDARLIAAAAAAFGSNLRGAGWLFLPSDGIVRPAPEKGWNDDADDAVSLNPLPLLGLDHKKH